MFTVKASYKHETRKFSFDSDSFPSYTQLHEQVKSSPVPSLLLMLIFALPPAHSSLPYYSFPSPLSFVFLSAVYNPWDHPHRHTGHQR